MRRLAVLAVHHWGDFGRAWTEIRRVVRERAVFLTFDPAAPPFWLTRDYLPQIRKLEAARLSPALGLRIVGHSQGSAASDTP
jgi:hypothetical protein